LILVVIVDRVVVETALRVVGRHLPVTVVNEVVAETFPRAKMTAGNAITTGVTTTAPGAPMIGIEGLSKMMMIDMVIEKTAQMGMIGKVSAQRPAPSFYGYCR
jgi:hypothetical protein